MKSLALLFLVFLFSFAVKAEESNSSGRVLRAGAIVGNNQLLQDVGTRAGTAVGFGFAADYLFEPETAIEVSFTQSQHKKLKHTDILTGMYRYLTGIANELSIGFGVAFITNESKFDGKTLISYGYGIYGSLAYDIAIWRSFSFVPLVRYVKGFEQTVQLANGDRTPNLQDHAFWGAKLLYSF